MVAFGEFRLDEESGRLWHRGATLVLRPKSLAVLAELARRPGRLVTKEQFLHACWPDTTVTPTVLRVCIGEIRGALAEADGSIAVETVGRRGYRLVVASADPTGDTPIPLVGRDRERRMLDRGFKRAAAGVRRMLLVRGEPGIGKTSLLRDFFDSLQAMHARVALATCPEMTGSVEPYLPILEILGCLAADDPDGSVLATLERWAPAWLLQMPGLVDGATAERLRLRVPNPNRDRLLRELADAFDALAVDRTLVLGIDDAHWMDASSADALAYVAQRAMPARLLVVASYRPADLRRQGGPVLATVQRLLAVRRAGEVPLAPLGPDDTAALVARRLAGADVDPGLARDLHARTEGNPLFLTATVDHLLERGILAAEAGRWHCATSLEESVPEGLRALVLQQLDSLQPDDRRVLDGACVVGTKFDVAAVSAATGLSPAEVEDRCAALATSQELVARVGPVAWPDGTITARYEFRHVLYRQVLEEALAPSVRRALHDGVARQFEGAWGAACATIAAELAFHFAAAAQPERAVHHHRVAAGIARERFADGEAAVHLRAALVQLELMPASPARSQSELELLLELAGALAASRGIAAEVVRDVHVRALQLTDELDAPLARFQVHGGLYAFDVMRGDLRSARTAAEAMLESAVSMSVPFFTCVAEVMLGCALFNLGDFAGARQRLASARSSWDPGFPRLAFDPEVLSRVMLGFAAVVQGDAAVADDCIRGCLEHAEESCTPYNRSYARELVAQYHATVGDRAKARDAAAGAAVLAEEHGFAVHAAVAILVDGWSRGDAERVRAGIAAYEDAGQCLGASFFRALLVEALLDEDRPAQALEELALAFAYVERSEERRHLAELHRLEGECLRRVAPDRAREALERALAVARDQGNRLWELRAAISLADFLVADGDPQLAREVVAEAAPLAAGLAPLPDASRFDEIRARL